MQSTPRSRLYNSEIGDGYGLGAEHWHHGNSDGDGIGYHGNTGHGDGHGYIAFDSWWAVQGPDVLVGVAINREGYLDLPVSTAIEFLK